MSFCSTYMMQNSGIWDEIPVYKSLCIFRWLDADTTLSTGYDTEEQAKTFVSELPFLTAMFLHL